MTKPKGIGGRVGVALVDKPCEQLESLTIIKRNPATKISISKGEPR